MAYFMNSVVTVRVPVNRAPHLEFCTKPVLKRRTIGVGTQLGITGGVVKYGSSNIINPAASTIIGKKVTGSVMVVGQIVPICILNYMGDGYTYGDLEQLLSAAHPSVCFRLRNSAGGRFRLLFETTGQGLDFGTYAKLLGFV